jgi:predicted ArsR family transcriptional regulator
VAQRNNQRGKTAPTAVASRDEEVQRQARALGDPTRNALFRWVHTRGAPVGVADLEAQFALNHTTIRQHLARLVEAGLLVEATAPPAGPGRPRLVYRVAPGVEGTWQHDGPSERLALLLLETLTRGTPPREVGRAEGRRLAALDAATVDPRDAMCEHMAEQGFAPRRSGGGRRTDVVMGRCPFEAAAAAAPDVVCDLHRGLAEGMAEVLGGVEVRDLLARPPHRAGCRLQLEIAEPQPSS